jgi:cytohesin
VCEYLLQHGADVNAKQDEGYTSLMAAAEHGYTGVVRVLLSHGADVTSKDDDGRTALSLAEKNGHTEAALLLKDALGLLPRATQPARK